MATVAPGDLAADNEKVITVMAEDLSIKGTISFKSSLRIEGSVEGEIESEGLLVIAPTAKIVATIKTKKLVSEGTTEGDVTATEQVVLKKNSVHTGSITAPNFVVESGSKLNGPVIMTRSASAPPVQQEVVVTQSEVKTEVPVDEPQETETAEQASPAYNAEPVAESEPEPEPAPTPWSSRQPAKRLF